MNNIGYINTSNSNPLPGFGDGMNAPEGPFAKISRVGKAILGPLGALTVAGTALAFVPSPWLPVSAVAAVIVVGAIGLKILLSKTETRTPFNMDLIRENNAGAPNVGTPMQADVIVSNDVQDTFRWKSELIQSAKESVECSLNFAGGDQFREILRPIGNKLLLSKTFKAHLIMSPDFLEQRDRELLANFQEAFPNRFHYLVTDRQAKSLPTPHSEENHVKLLVVDEKYFVIGGSGVQPRMVNNDPAVKASGKESFFIRQTIDHSFKDSDVIGRGQDKRNIAKTMRAQFFNLYQVWAYRMKKPLSKDEGRIFAVTQAGEPSRFHRSQNVVRNAEMRFLVCAPEFSGNPIDHLLANSIEAASEEVRIANLHYVPSQKIQQALRDTKAKRKVGYFNGDTSLAHYSFVAQNRQFYSDFDTVYEATTVGQCYHKKVLTVDKEVSFCGSYNLGRKSHEHDYEAGLFFNSAEVTKRFNEGLDEDQTRARPISTPQSRKTLAGALLVTVLGPHL